MATTIPALNTKFSDVRFAYFNERYTETYTEIPGEPLPAAPSNLNAYRRGGGFVPDTAAPATLGAGTEGDPLQLSQFSGFTVPTRTAIANLTEHSGIVEHNVFAQQGEASTFTELRIGNNGAITIEGSTGWSQFYTPTGSILIDGNQYWDGSFEGSSSGPINVQNWLIGGGASLYSCRGTIQTAFSTNPDGFTTFRYGTFGSWISLAGSPTFAVQTSATSSYPNRSITLVLLLEFARTDNLSNILGSCTITISGEATFSNQNPEFIE